MRTKAFELREGPVVPDDDFRAEVFAARTDARAVPPCTLSVTVSVALDGFDDDVPIHANARRMGWGPR